MAIRPNEARRGQLVTDAKEIAVGGGRLGDDFLVEGARGVRAEDAHVVGLTRVAVCRLAY